MLTNKVLFRKITFITTIAVYLLILVGGIVRNTGSGMGCPDWPKCFGSYVPPTSDENLPKGYQKIYLEKRLAKTDRLVRLLTKLGMNATAQKLMNDPNIDREERFDVKTAWIEYINRLIGVVIGFLIIATTATSFSYWNEKRAVTIMAILGLVLVLFQGWFGSLVVATNLIPGFVSVHMFLALLQIAILTYLLYASEKESSSLDSGIFVGALVLFILMLAQLFLGTKVRHVIDQAVFNELDKALWLSGIDWTFYVHRSLSILIFIGAGFMLYRSLKKRNLSKGHLRVVTSIFGLVVLEAIGGAVMYYLDFPPFIQPLHLLMASLLFGLLFYLLLASRKSVNSLS